MTAAIPRPVAAFPREILRPPRRWAEGVFAIRRAENRQIPRPPTAPPERR